MMTFVTLVALVAGAAAVPQPQDLEQGSNARFLVEATIKRVIEDLKNTIKDNHLDPLVVEGSALELDLIPNSNLVRVAASLGTIEVKGLSDILTNRVSYTALTGRLILDLSMPSLNACLGKSRASLQIWQYELDAEVGGCLALLEQRILVDMRISISIFGKVTIRSIDLQYTQKAIQSTLEIRALGRDYSKQVNEFLEVNVLGLLIENGDVINKALEDLILALFEDM